jgi:MFS family permease
VPRARVLLGFAALGVFWGAWGAALPAVQRKSGATDAELGLALLLVGLGALLAMRATGVLLDRLGPRVTPLTIGGFGITGLLPGLASSPDQLYVALFALGVTSGAMDVAVNADAVREEQRTNRPLLNLAHASFSGAVVVGSLGAGALRAAGAEPAVVLALSALAVLLVAVAVYTGGREGRPEPGPDLPRLFEGVPGWVLVLGGLLALAFWIESAWQNWSSVHLERTLDTTAGVSAFGPAAFAGAMTIGRLAAQRLLEHVSERRLLVLGALTAGLGSGLAAAAPSASVALAGIVIAGAGCSVCAPTIVSLAGKAATARERATMIGSVTTLAYLGFLLGPAAVGGLAELESLRISLGVVAALGLLLAVLFAAVRLPTAQRAG